MADFSHIQPGLKGEARWAVTEETSTLRWGMKGIAELATLVQEDLPLTILLLNDGGYRASRNAQEAAYRGRGIACDLRNPDFVPLARSFGLRARRIEGVEEIEDALQEALSAGGVPHLIELPLSLASP